jgi:hypothetical protein
VRSRLSQTFHTLFNVPIQRLIFTEGRKDHKDVSLLKSCLGALCGLDVKTSWRVAQSGAQKP